MGSSPVVIRAKKMVYISPDGRVEDPNTWSIAKAKRIFWNFVDGVILFVQTLVNPNASRRGDRYVTQYGAPSSRSSGLYSSNTQRRIGRPGGVGGASPPPVSAGG